MGSVGFKIEIDQHQLNQILESKRKEIEQYIRSEFIEVGERFMDYAQTNGEYMNHTYALISSIGYVVVFRGQVIHENFKVIGSGSNGREMGIKVAHEAIRELPDDTDYALIGVAGMGYAIYVESRGKDVITGSATNVVEQMLKSLAE